jgi:hypothetical protein
MKEWIPTSQIEPADLEGRTVSGRFGAAVMFTAFSSVTGWHWIYPQGMEAISEPPLLFLEPQWARLHPRRSPVIHREKVGIRKRKTNQLLLEL